MIAKLTILSNLVNVNNVDLIPEMSFSDVMDGNPDTLSFSFILDNNIVENILLKTKAQVLIYDDDNVLKKTYNMAITDISSERISMAVDNGYYYTIKLKEHSVYLKDCIRTDLTITPSLYPYSVFPTLKEALFKVIDTHNIPKFNEPILEVDEVILNKLSNIACNNITYKDLSTFDQINDLFERIGYVPYLEDGYLTGFSKQGSRNKTSELLEILKISSFSSSKNEGINYDVITTKSYNTIFDEENIFVPNAFLSINPNGVEVREDGTMAYADILYSGGTAPNKVEISNYFSLRYAHWLTGVAEDYNSVSYDDVVTSRLLFVSNFDTNAYGANDARQYYIELPSNIEYISNLYYVHPEVEIENNVDTITPTNSYSRCYFKWDLNEISLDRLVEKTIYDNLSALQQRLVAYYKKGDNKIYNVIALLASAANLGVDLATDTIIQGSLIWADATLFDILKKYTFACNYKPMTNQQYTSYDYSKELNEEKPLSIQNINLPYKQVSDKQVSNVLAYELEKKSDTRYNIKFMTSDINILDFQASDIIEIQNEIYIISNMTTIFTNNLFEVSFELNKKVIFNSMVSNYTDNIRVSSNLSSEDLVVRDLPIFKENILILNDSYVDKSTFSTYVSKDYEEMLSYNGLEGNGFQTLYIDEASRNALSKTSNYYSYIEGIIQNEDDWLSKIYIPYKSMDIGVEGDISTIDITSFPIYIRKAYAITLNPVRTDFGTSSTDTTTTINNFAELTSFLATNDVGIYRDSFINISGELAPYAVITYSIWDNTSNFRQGLRWYGNIFNNPNKENKAKFYLQYPDEIYPKRNYEKIISTSGLITSMNFKYKDPASTSLNVNSNVSFGSLIADVPSTEGVYTYSVDDCDILNVKPILYNNTKTGAIIRQVANIDLESHFNLYSSNKYGLYLDLRETINPYIQYMTISSKDSLDLNCEITELNTNVNWLSLSPKTRATVSELYLYKIDEKMSLNTLDLRKIIDEDFNEVDLTPKYAKLVSSIHIWHSVSKIDIFELDGVTPKEIEYEQGYQYVIVKEQGDTRVPLFKFKIKDDVSSLYMHSYIVE